MLHDASGDGIYAAVFTARFAHRLYESPVLRIYGKPRIGRDHVRSLIELAFGFEVPDRPQKEAIQPALRCPECGSMLVLRYVTDSLFGPGKGAG